MKKTLIKITIALVLGFFAARTALAQGFVNLNFEQATIIPASTNPELQFYIATTNALPGWTVLYGANQQSLITFNAPALGTTWVYLWATNGEQLSGNYSVLLQGGGTASAASISQTGLVPANAESLLFIGVGSASDPNASALQLSLGGQDLSFVVISNELNYTLYGADVSAFAGQMEALTFSALEVSTGYNDWNIDNIQFSTQPVPEPSELALVALGALFLGFRRWRNSSR